MAQGLQAFVEINNADAENGTQHLILGIDVVATTKRTAGTEVTIGVGGDHVAAIATGQKMAVLLLVDRKEYDRVTGK